MALSAQIKGQLCLKSSIEKSYENFKKSPKDRLKKESYLVTRLESLEEKWKVVLKTHSELLSIEEIYEHRYMKDSLYETMEELYIDYKSELKEAISSLKVDDKQSQSQTVSKADTNVMLPKISIPTFSGSYTEWTTFKDLYVSLVHNNPSIDNVQKMHYLKSNLSGEAEQLLRHVPITHANYEESWLTLNNRYNNKKYLANNLLKRFMNQPCIGNESCSAIKDLLDVTNETLNGLKNLGIDVSAWDTIVIYIICSKLDAESRKEWEFKISTHSELPTLTQMREFLESRFRSLEFLDPKQKTKPGFSNHKPKVMHALTDSSEAVAKTCCPFCKCSEHKLANCKEFSKLDYEQRHEYVQTNSLCFNCLGKNHSAYICRVPIRCHICKHKHHSLLHPSQKSITKSIVVPKSDLDAQVKSTLSKVKTSLNESNSNVKAHFSQNEGTKQQVLLATAVVGAQSKHGQVRLLRALVDQGSQASFVTESAVQMLGLRKIPNRINISGVGGDDKSKFASKYIVMITIQSRHDPSFKLQVHAHVLGAITSLLPSDKVEYVDWPQLAELVLADPQFHTPSKIDILLGADVYSQIIRDGLVKGPNGTPTAQCTAFGWIVSGPTQPTSIEADKNQHCHHNVIVSMHSCTEDLLKQFWQIESDTIDSKIPTLEEQRCEEFYAETTRRDTSGRYVVRLPFRDEDPQCKYGNSKEIALKRFHLLERRFKKNPEIKQRYADVIHEYLDLGHMVRVTGDDKNKADAVYLPHHAVIREDKSTTKVRVVFDASCKGVNGVSLNDTLMIGPTLQKDLRHIIIRWRMHPICLTADIVKMYRQVCVAEEDVDFQRLVWRDDPGAEIEIYKLVRVTFGTAPAPYLAVKTLQQIATDFGKECPDVAEKVKADFYVDDLLTGCQTVEEGKNIFKEMKRLLSKGGLELQKWMTNNKEMEEVVMENQEPKEGKINLRLDDMVKILGLSWDKGSDAFHYTVQLPDLQGPVTKRKVISNIARLFDPLGWIAPCIVIAKIMIQKLWLAGIHWDDELPKELCNEWLTYQSELANVCKISIPRWLEVTVDDTNMELQGFCDASNAAYAAVVYLRTIDVEGKVHVNLVASKTKVAPTMQVSIPRLELMGAVLLAKLILEVSNLLNIDRSKIHAWTDSTVVLAWLSSHPSRWSTFIGNRTSDILSRIDNTQWSHVQSLQNPADVASRGCTPLELANNSMWLQGPIWLKESEIIYNKPESSTDLEQRKIKVHLAASSEKEIIDQDLWTKFSTLQRLIRVIAYCRRFLRYKKNSKFEPCLTTHELNEALQCCIRQSQKELGNIKNKLKPLSPFFDEEKIMRVGGRIQKSDLPEEMKHPIILPHKNHFTNLVIDDAHRKTLHGGPTLMLTHLRTRYWIISAKSSVKLHVRKCVVCIRYAARPKTPFMGQLPTSRVTQTRPFLHSGVDFAGPINVRMTKGRGNKSFKGYICLFVCMATKAIHLEVVSDLTSDGFIAAFKRFVARRGHVSDIWSDNGTNFVGASKELHKLVGSEQSLVSLEIREWLGNNDVSWHFIPAHAPNFGGLWEAGVKATKFHLKRVIARSVKKFKKLKRSSSMPNMLPSDLGPEERRGPIPPIHPNFDDVTEVGLLDVDEKVEDVIALENDTALFECKVVQDLKPTCTWHKDGNTLQSDDERVSVIKNHAWHRLEIKHTNASDQGIYTIECRHNQQYISVKGHLFVAPRNVDDGVFYHCTPYTGLGVIKHLCNTKVLKGEKIMLEAKFNYSVEEYTWYKNNDVVLQDVRTIIYSRAGYAFMVVSNAKPTDTGIYFVVAKTEQGYLSSCADVQVGDCNEKRQCFPIIEEYLPDDLEVVAGEEIRLVLKVHTDSNTIIRWEKDNALIENENMVMIDYGFNYHGLNLPHATDSSTGEYRVILQNGQVSRGISTSTNVTITPSPENLPHVIPLSVPESAVACCGSKVTFDCIFDLTQTNYFYVVWYVGHYKVERTNSQFNVICNGGHFILYIKKLEPSMAGDVICELRRAWPNRKSGLIKRVCARLVIVPLSMIQEAKTRPVLLGNLYDEHNRYNTSIRIRDYIDSRYFADKVGSSYLLEIVYCRLDEEGLYFGKVVRGSASYINASRLSVSADKQGRYLVFRWNEDIIPHHCWFGIELGQTNGTFADCGVTSVPHFSVETPPIERILIFRIKALEPPQHICDSVVHIDLLPENISQPAIPQDIQPMEAFADKYMEGNIVIGTGAYGCVWLVQNKQDGLKYAAKVVKALTEKNREQILREFDIMKSLCHPKLIQLIGFYESKFTYVFTMEYCWGGELFYRVVGDEYLREVDVVGYVKQICQALEYLHRNTIAHLDLKPENIICMSPNSTQVKLIDFGVARYVTKNLARVMYGTPDYIAPEVIDYEPITTASDMWSLGVVTYMLLSGMMPFAGETWPERSVNITMVKYDYNDYVFNEVSDKAKDFVDNLLLRQPDRRISAKEALRHCWIKDGPPQRMNAKHLYKMRQNLKSYLADYRSKWQRAGNVMIAAHRLRMNLRHEASSSDRTPEPI